jgi:hypothetical protein
MNFTALPLRTANSAAKLHALHVWIRSSRGADGEDLLTLMVDH